MAQEELRHLDTLAPEDVNTIALAAAYEPKVAYKLNYA